MEDAVTREDTRPGSVMWWCTPAEYKLQTTLNLITRPRSEVPLTEGILREHPAAGVVPGYNLQSAGHLDIITITFNIRNCIYTVDMQNMQIGKWCSYIGIALPIT